MGHVQGDPLSELRWAPPCMATALAQRRKPGAQATISKPDAAPVCVCVRVCGNSPGAAGMATFTIQHPSWAPWPSQAQLRQHPLPSLWVSSQLGCH